MGPLFFMGHTELSLFLSVSSSYPPLTSRVVIRLYKELLVAETCFHPFPGLSGSSQQYRPGISLYTTILPL